MNNWSKEKIGSFAEVVGGGTPSRKKEDVYFGGNIPWVSPRDLTDHNSRFVRKGAENITKEGLNNSSAKLLPKNAILFSSRATIGNLAIAKNPISTSQGFRSLVCKDEKAIPSFVYYALQYYTPQIEQIASGATYKEISGSSLANFEIELPPLKAQQKIASILSAFDDLIENNSCRIEILEEMAHRIYREWFVDFRFPGHEQVELVDSGTELGQIPEGWEVKRVDESFETLGGGTPSRKKEEYWIDGIHAWYTPSDLTAGNSMFMNESSERINNLGLKKSSAKLFPAHSIMMTSRATIGVVSINVTEACTNQGFITCIPNENFNKYQIYYWLKEIMPLIKKLASGATYKEINKGTFRNLEVIIPIKDLSDRFYEIINPLGLQIQNLLQTNQNLKQTRDLLLPKLISGEIKVYQSKVKKIKISK